MVLVNRKAKRNYRIFEEIEAGVVLSGSEVKSLRLGKGNLSDAYVKIIGSEVWLVNFLIPRYQKGHEEYDLRKSRKLLLKKKEILSLGKKMEGKNLSLVPLKLYFKNNLVKVRVGLGKGKKRFEKKEALKRKDQRRELRRSFKEEQIR